MNFLNLAELRKRTVVIRAAPFLLFVGFLMLSSAATGWFDLGVSSSLGSWLVIGRAILVTIVLALFWTAYSELRDPSSVSAVDWATAVVAGLVVFIVWVELHQAGAVMTQSDKFAPLLADGSLDWPMAMLRLAGLALVVPVMEELFWRSLILRWIEKHEFLTVAPSQIGFGAFAITTVLFAVEHDMWLAGAFAGIVYNWLYMRSGNLWVPIASHAVTNGALGIWIIYTRNWQFW
jgi:CAAX prenyl protease-like protein